MRTPPTAGIVVIGNEVLSGRVEENNANFLTKELAKIGVELLEVSVIPDDFERIGSVVHSASMRFSWVFTSGGIGPTHDDITMNAIASAFGVDLVLDQNVKTSLESHYQEALTADHLRMAQFPEGSKFVPVADRGAPQVLFKNIFIMPGIPILLQKRYKAVKHLLGGVPWISKVFSVYCDEPRIAPIMRELDAEHNSVRIGSYPQYESPFWVKVIIESRNLDALEGIAQKFATHVAELGIKFNQNNS